MTARRNVQCYLITPTGNVVRQLRRYGQDSTGGRNCPGPFGYHNALAPLDTVAGTDARGQPATFLTGDRGRVPVDVSGDLWPRADPRWPAACGCGYVFQDTDPWQLFTLDEYRRPAGEVGTLRDFSPGAMWWATWLADGPHSQRHTARGGGPHLIVKTPGGDWDMDGASSNGDGWDRHGDPPLVTVRPSIQIAAAAGGGGYHAYLTDGVLQRLD